MLLKTDMPRIIETLFQNLRLKLGPKYVYHSIAHTAMVLRDATFLANKMRISEADLHLLQIAACLHDYGIVDDYDHHEEVGCAFAQKILPTIKLSRGDIDAVCNLIMATKFPQQPKTLLEKIICDADLFYVSTPYYFPIANLYRQEEELLGRPINDTDWRNIQIEFFTSFKLHTPFCAEFHERGKQDNFALLKGIVS